MDNSMTDMFLLFSLFFPRITLFVYWLNNSIPTNTVPFWGDVLMTIFIPRVLILIYLVQNDMFSTPWFWVHLVVAIIVYVVSSSKNKNSKNLIDSI